MKEKTGVLLALVFIFLIATAACVDCNHSMAAFGFFIITGYCTIELIDSL